MKRIRFQLEDGTRISGPIPDDIPTPHVALLMQTMWKTKGVIVVRGLVDPVVASQRPDADTFQDPRIQEMARHLTGVDKFTVETEQNPTYRWRQQQLPSWLAMRGLRVYVALTDCRISDGPFEYLAGSHNWFEVIHYELLDPLNRDKLAYTMQSVADVNPEHVDRLVLRAGDVVFIHSDVLVRRGEVAPGGKGFEALCAHFSESVVDDDV